MTGLRVGSIAWQLDRLKPGESALFEVPAARSPSDFQCTIGGTASRMRLAGHFRMSMLLCVEPSTRKVYDIVRVTRAVIDAPVN